MSYYGFLMFIALFSLSGIASIDQIAVENCFCPKGNKFFQKYCGFELKEFNRLSENPVVKNGCEDETIYRCYFENQTTTLLVKCSQTNLVCSLPTANMPARYSRVNVEDTSQRVCLQESEENNSAWVCPRADGSFQEDFGKETCLKRVQFEFLVGDGDLNREFETMEMSTSVAVTVGESGESAIQNERKSWLDHKIIIAIRKIKLVGLNQALDPGITLIERLLWVGVFFICLGTSVYLTVKTMIEYAENPIQNTFGEKEPIYKFPFPATTITGTMILKDNAWRDLMIMEDDVWTYEENQFEGHMLDIGHINIAWHMLDHFCKLVSSFARKEGMIHSEADESIKLMDDPRWLKAKNVTLYDNKNVPALKDIVIPFMKKKTLDCTKILAACYWEGDNKTCKEMFIPIQTDVGTGCTFNRIPEKLLRKHQGLLSLLHDHEFTEEEMQEWRKFDIDSSISAEGMQDFYDFTYPRSQHQAGKLSGLSFMLIFDENPQGMSCPIVDSNGYLISIHSPFEEPQLLQTGITVPPNMEVFVNVKAEAVFADKNIRSLAIAKRRCYFQDEKPLKNFQFYTVANCHQECLGSAIQTNCSCSLLTRSVGKNERLCGPQDSVCVKKTAAVLRNEGYDRRCLNPVCYSPCTEMEYHADATFLPYHTRKYLNFKSSLGLKENAVTSMVHVTHGSDMISTRERQLRFSFSVLVGVIGGIWGMMMDITLFSAFNILARIISPFVPKRTHWERVRSSCASKLEIWSQAFKGTQCIVTRKDPNTTDQQVSGERSPAKMSTLSTGTLNERKKAKKQVNDPSVFPELPGYIP